MTFRGAHFDFLIAKTNAFAFAALSATSEAENTPCYRSLCIGGDMDELANIQQISNEELILRVTHSVKEDRRVSALLLAHFGEMEVRGLYRDLGYDSMFNYAVHELHMSDSEAALRIYAARFARKFPAALEMLSRGELHLTAMKLLQPVLTDENIELLHLSRLKTKQEIQQLIAKHCPQPDVPELIRRLPAARLPVPVVVEQTLVNSAATSHAVLSAMSLVAASPMSATDPKDASPSSLDEQNSSSGSRPQLQVFSTGSAEATKPQPMQAAELAAFSASTTAPPPTLLAVAATPPCNREAITPLREGRYKIQFTANQNVRDLIQEAQNLYRNQLPSGDVAAIVERALELLVAERRQQVYAQTDKPRRAQADGLRTTQLQAPRGSQTPSARTGTPPELQTHTMRAATPHDAQTRTPRAVTTPHDAQTRTARSATPHASQPHLRQNRSTSKSMSRHIPNEVKRRVFARDQGQCSFVGTNGVRCRARDRLEFHHVHAYGLGGLATESNIVLCCRAHNRLFAERDFTREHIQRCIEESRAPAEQSPRSTLRRTESAIVAGVPQEEAASVPQYSSTCSRTSERSVGP